MTKYFLPILLVLVVACGKKNYPNNNTAANNTFINANGDTILIGVAKPNILVQQPWAKWYDTNYAKYKVDTVKALQVAKSLSTKTIDIFLGTWCGDSRREVPKFMKMLNSIGFNNNNVNLIFVDNADENYKKSNKGEEVGKNIHHVPTFIIYDEKKNEMGRIVETALESFEKDVATIVSKICYTPKYKAIELWNASSLSNKTNLLDSIEVEKAANQLSVVCRHSGELNTLGYVLMGQKKQNQALNVFLINAKIYPLVANVYDSLGETYFKMGNKDKAIECYKKVLQLDPNNKSALAMLNKLQ